MLSGSVFHKGQTVTATKDLLLIYMYDVKEMITERASTPKCVSFTFIGHEHEIVSTVLR